MIFRKLCDSKSSCNLLRSFSISLSFHFLNGSCCESRTTRRLRISVAWYNNTLYTSVPSPIVFLSSGLFVGNTEDPPGEVSRAEMADESKVGALTRFVEVLATIGSFLLVLVTLPFSLCFTFKVVQEYERAVVFRMGRLKSGAYGPGKRAYVIFISPFVSKRTSWLSVTSFADKEKMVQPFHCCCMLGIYGICWHTVGAITCFKNIRFERAWYALAIRFLFERNVEVCWKEKYSSFLSKCSCREIPKRFFFKTD